MRPPRRGDLAALHAILGDAEAMALTHAEPDARATRRRVLVHERMRRRDGCAPWVAERRGDRAVIGWGGLYVDPFEPGWGVEVGFFFHRAAWGRGYASELTAAALEAADGPLALAEVGAMAHPENAGSRRVLEKAGFEAVRLLPERPRILYRRPRFGRAAGAGG
ncbi:MAG: GNAT family N-acetyltransferase [Pseudomonadota bacterium]